MVGSRQLWNECMRHISASDQPEPWSGHHHGDGRKNRRAAKPAARHERENARDDQRHSTGSRQCGEPRKNPGRQSAFIKQRQQCRRDKKGE